MMSVSDTRRARSTLAPNRRYLSYLCLLVCCVFSSSARAAPAAAPKPARTTDYLVGFTRVGNLDTIYTQSFHKYADVIVHGCERVVVDPLGDLSALIRAEGASGREFTASVIWYFVFPDQCFEPIYRKEYLRCQRPNALSDCYTTSPFLWAREFYATAALTDSLTGLELFGVTQDLSGNYLLVVRVGSSMRTAVVSLTVAGNCPRIPPVEQRFRATCWRGHQYETGFNGDTLHLFHSESRHRDIAQQNFLRKLERWEREEESMPARTPTTSQPVPPRDADPTDMNPQEPEVVTDPVPVSGHGDDYYEKEEVEDDEGYGCPPGEPHCGYEDRHPVATKPPKGDSAPPSGSGDAGDDFHEERPTFSLTAFVLVSICALLLLSLVMCAVKKCCCKR